MLKKIFLILPIILLVSAYSQITVTDIYTVQQDSTLIGREVAVIGIVSATTGIYDVKRTYIQDSDGGAWSGLAIWDNSGAFYAEEGDRIRVIGTVAETNGLTEIRVNSYYVYSGTYPVPDTIMVNTSDFAPGSPTAEQYESILVQVNSVSVTNDSLGDGEWLVDDGSGACRIDDEADYLSYDVPEIGTDISSITGVLNYSNNNFKIEPRYRSDIADGDTSTFFTIPQVRQNISLLGDTVTVMGIVTAATGTFQPGQTFIEDARGGVFSGILIDDTTHVMSVEEGDEIRVTGMLSDDNGMAKILVSGFDVFSKGNPLPSVELVTSGDISPNSENAEFYESVLVKVIDIYVSDDNPGGGDWEVNDVAGACDGLMETCLIGNDASNLSFTIPTTGSPITSVTGLIVYNDKKYRLQPRYLSDIVEGATVPIGDTLTLIQRPLLNIAAIHQPGDTLEILCDLKQEPISWSASLINSGHETSLPIIGQVFDDVRKLWWLKVQIPDITISKLYDLKLEVPGEETDIEKNAVQIIPGYEDDFYFIHITDTHLPTTNYCRDDNYLQDSSSIQDLRAVMADINIINPAFVLHTGDLIHEGELEEYLHNRYYSKTKRVLSELQVPLYLVAGNHDIGGWSSTPMSQGTARRDWWRFFGWKYLDNPDGDHSYYTQDYSFRYGNCHFVGLEAYLNYDWWRKDIYGGESFIDGQMTWLEQNLSAVDDSLLKVLFYHYDFDQELDLEPLGVDLALWGHTHDSYGSLDTHPLDIGTEACSNGRAYRIIRVQGNTIIPAPTLRAGDSGENLNIEYEPANNGLNYIVKARIENKLDERFEHATLRFIMPKDGDNPLLSAGEIEQIDNTGSNAIYYISLDILANSTQEVTLSLYSAGAGPFAQNCTLDASHIESGSDTLHIKSRIVNPDNHDVLVTSIFESTDLSIRDSVAMYDDASHGDSAAGDGIYSSYWTATPAEKDYNVHIRTITQDSVYSNLLTDAAYFTTIGPVKFDSVYIAQHVGNIFRVRLILSNQGLTSIANNISANLKISNSGFTIKDNSQFFDDIEPGQTAQSVYFYSLINSNPPDSVQIYIDIFSDDKLFWKDSFTLSFVALDISGADQVLPRKFSLQQNYPNPFNPSTTIEFSIPQKEFVNLRVFDSVGQQVAILLNRQLGAGNYEYVWDASGIASGVYYYRIEAGKYRQSRKLILVK